MIGNRIEEVVKDVHRITVQLETFIMGEDNLYDDYHEYKYGNDNSFTKEEMLNNLRQLNKELSFLTVFVRKSMVFICTSYSQMSIIQKQTLCDELELDIMSLDRHSRDNELTNDEFKKLFMFFFS